MRIASIGIPLLALAVVAPAAEARVTTPVRVSPSGTRVQDSAVGAGGNRTAVLMSTYTRSGGRRHYELYARVGTSRRLGALQRLARRRGGTPSVAVGADGTAVAAWVEDRTGPRVAVAPPGKAFGAPRQLNATTANLASPRPAIMLGGVAVTSLGRAVVTWSAGSSAEVATAASGRAFGPTRVLGTSGFSPPSVTVGLEASAVATWLDTPLEPAPGAAPADARLLATTLAASRASFDVPTTLVAYPSWSRAHLGTGPGGAVIAWQQDQQIRVVRPTIDGGFAPARGVPAAEIVEGYGAVTEGDGAMVVGWLGVSYPSTQPLAPGTAAVPLSAVRVSVLPNSSAPSTTQNLSTENGWFASRPRLSALADRTLAVWGETDDQNASRLRLMVHRPGAAWRPQTSVPTRGLELASMNAAGGAHHAALTWIQITSRSEGSGPMYLATYRP